MSWVGYHNKKVDFSYIFINVNNSILIEIYPSIIRTIETYLQRSILTGLSHLTVQLQMTENWKWFLYLKQIVYTNNWRSFTNNSRCSRRFHNVKMSMQMLKMLYRIVSSYWHTTWIFNYAWVFYQKENFFICQFTKSKFPFPTLLKETIF